jgi:Zn-dependent protease with chaperone function
MSSPVSYKVQPKENIYFVLKVLAALLGYFLIYKLIEGAVLAENPQDPSIIFSIYLVVILIFLFVRQGVLIGHIKGNGVKVTDKQFPMVHKIMQEQCSQLGITNTPDLYLVQHGGLLNAFATRFLGANYVVIYSDVFHEAYESNIDTVAFILAHELGHVKRKHVLKKSLLFPSFIIPFLGAAYSRACEMTCDNIGAALSPDGVKPGLMLLAAGKNMWRKTDMNRFMEQESSERGFWFWFAEKVSTHPRLTKRMLRFKDLAVKSTAKTILEQQAQVQAQPEPEAPKKSSDHSSYMPKF